MLNTQLKTFLIGGVIPYEPLISSKQLGYLGLLIGQVGQAKALEAQPDFRNTGLFLVQAQQRPYCLA